MENQELSNKGPLNSPGQDDAKPTAPVWLDTTYVGCTWDFWYEDTVCFEQECPCNSSRNLVVRVIESRVSDYTVMACVPDEPEIEVRVPTEREALALAHEMEEKLSELAAGNVEDKHAWYEEFASQYR